MLNDEMIRYGQKLKSVLMKVYFFMFIGFIVVGFVHFHFMQTRHQRDISKLPVELQEKLSQVEKETSRLDRERIEKAQRAFLTWEKSDREASSIADRNFLESLRQEQEIRSQAPFLSWSKKLYVALGFNGEY